MGGRVGGQDSEPVDPQTVLHDGLALSPAPTGSLVTGARLEGVTCFLAPEQSSRVVALATADTRLSEDQVVAVTTVVVVGGVADGVCSTEQLRCFAHHDLLPTVLARVAWLRSLAHEATVLIGLAITV